MELQEQIQLCFFSLSRFLQIIQQNPFLLCLGQFTQSLQFVKSNLKSPRLAPQIV